MSERGSTIDVYSINRENIIYLAGLIDGVGCFFISKRVKPTKNGYADYMLKLQIHCINEALIDWILSVFGGIKVIYHKKKLPRKPLYGAEFTGNRLTQMCELLIPFLRLKKPNAENMLEMRRTYNGHGGRIQVTEANQMIRDKCFAYSRQLNTHKPITALPPCCPSALCSLEIQVN